MTQESNRLDEAGIDRLMAAAAGTVDMALHAAVRLCQADNGSVFLCERVGEKQYLFIAAYHGHEWTLPYAEGIPEEYLNKPELEQLDMNGLAKSDLVLDVQGMGITSQCVRENRPILVPDVVAPQNHVPVFEGIQSELCAPIRLGGVCRGGIILDSSALNHFDSEDEAVLLRLCDCMSSFLEQLHEDLETHWRKVVDHCREEIGQCVQSYVAGEKSAEEVERDIARIVAERGANLLKVEHTSVWLRKPDAPDGPAYLAGLWPERTVRGQPEAIRQAWEKDKIITVEHIGSCDVMYEESDKARTAAVLASGRPHVTYDSAVDLGMPIPRGKWNDETEEEREWGLPPRVARRREPFVAYPIRGMCSPKPLGVFRAIMKRPVLPRPASLFFRIFTAQELVWLEELVGVAGAALELLWCKQQVKEGPHTSRGGKRKSTGSGRRQDGPAGSVTSG